MNRAFLDKCSVSSCSSSSSSSSLSDSDDERDVAPLSHIPVCYDASCGCAEAQPLSLLRNTRPLRRLGSQILMMKIRMHAFLLAIKPALDVVCLYLQICRHLAECATYSTKWTATGNLFVRELFVAHYFRRVATTATAASPLARRVNEIRQLLGELDQAISNSACHERPTSWSVGKVSYRYRLSFPPAFVKSVQHCSNLLLSVARNGTRFSDRFGG